MPVNRVALFLALLATIFWAGSQVGSSIILNNTSPALYVVLIEVFFILFGAIYILLNFKSAAYFVRTVRTNRAIQQILLACAASIFIYEVSFYYALSRGEKLITIVITSLWPMFTIFWGKCLRIASWNDIHLREILFAGLAFSGAALVTADHFGFALGKLDLPVVCCALAAAISGGFWDASTTKIIEQEKEQRLDAGADDKSLPELSKPNVIIFSIVLARFLLVPVFVAWLLLGGTPVSFDKNLILAAIAITFFGYVVSDLIFNIAISYSGASIISISYLVPILVTLLFKAVYGQSVSAFTLIGLYMVFFANFMLHTKSLKISPAMGATIFFILVVSGSVVINPASVKSIVGVDKSSDTVMQLVMAALAVALGFLLQQADGRNRDERAYLVNLFNCIAETTKSDQRQMDRVFSSDIYGKIIALRQSQEPVSAALEKNTELVEFFALNQGRSNYLASEKEARIHLAFDQWYKARRSIDETKDSWFLGALIFSIGLSIVVTSVSTPFLIVLSGIGASLLCYLWILLNASLLPEEIRGGNIG
jgi:drug/metabolite transporter (DMT)-like permease